MNCATVANDSVIVNEVTFGEAASGAALVQGTTIQEGQRYAPITGLNFFVNVPQDDKEKEQARYDTGTKPQV